MDESGSGPEGVDEPRVNSARPTDPMIGEMRQEPNPLKRFLKILGPGLVTGASDDDPSGIGTYAQAGASYGFATLWTTVLMLPMMISIQYISAKIGLVSGRGLGGVLRQQYPRIVVYPAVLALVSPTRSTRARISAPLPPPSTCSCRSRRSSSSSP